MQRIFRIAAIVAAVAMPSRADTAKYTIDDLQALDKQGAWQELYDHAGDIAPPKRDARWEGLLEHAMLGLLKSLDARPLDAASLADRATRLYPQLKAQKPFMARRAEVGLRALELCEQADDGDGAPCAVRFLAFVDDDPSNTDLAWRAGALIAPKHAVAAVPFLKRGLGGANGKRCTDKVLAAPVVAALAAKPSDPVVADAKLVGGDWCWDALKETLVDHFSTGSENYRRNTCGFMKTKQDVLSPLSLRQCDALK
jgi:hypothetical protein